MFKQDLHHTERTLPSHWALSACLARFANPFNGRSFHVGHVPSNPQTNQKDYQAMQLISVNCIRLQWCLHWSHEVDIIFFIHHDAIIHRIVPRPHHFMCHMSFQWEWQSHCSLQQAGWSRSGKRTLRNGGPKRPCTASDISKQPRWHQPSTSHTDPGHSYEKMVNNDGDNNG